MGSKAEKSGIKGRSEVTFKSAICGLHVVTRNTLEARWAARYLGATWCRGDVLTRQQKAQLEDLMFEVQNELEHTEDMLGARKAAKGTRHRVEQLMAARNVLLDMLGENIRPEGIDPPSVVKKMRWPAVEKMRRKMMGK